MNDRQKHIQKHVDDTMALLEQQAPIKAGPWFQSHVQNKLRRLSEPTASKWSWGTALLRPAILLVVVALNLTTVFAALTPSTDTEDARETYLNTMASEYRLSVSSELLEDYETTTEP
ncbi:MAG: hypothetical protein HQ515_00165 [Phycisphaeraceae bacterium]|nr:hypothetical protein [Phycisphaeraceae bacterium]